MKSLVIVFAVLFVGCSTSQLNQKIILLDSRIEQLEKANKELAEQLAIQNTDINLNFEDLRKNQEKIDGVDEHLESVIDQINAHHRNLYKADEYCRRVTDGLLDLFAPKLKELIEKLDGISNINNDNKENQ